jgi:polysaccharide export outer membrane protein
MTKALAGIVSLGLAFLTIAEPALAQTSQPAATTTKPAPTTAKPAPATTKPAPATTKPAPATTKPASPGATTASTAPVDYLIGPEDVLGVVFWREAEMSGDVAVRPDGIITLPLIGEMKASGQTTNALRDAIQAAAAKYLSEPVVSVVVRQLNSRKVFVTGEVMMPGAFDLTGPRTVVQVIALAGGLTEYAKSSEISIMREENGRTRQFKFNYKDFSRGRRLEQNIQLQPNDTIVVP